MTDLSQLWHIAHDRTEIPAGEFLGEIEALGYPLTQQTLSNYVARGWADRKRIETAPGGRGQTGYFERRMLVPVMLAAKAKGREPEALKKARKEAKGNTQEYVVRCLAQLQLPKLPAELTNIRGGVFTHGDPFRIRSFTVDYLHTVIVSAWPPSKNAGTAVISHLTRKPWEKEASNRLLDLYRLAIETPIAGSALEFDPVAAAGSEAQRVLEAHEAVLDLLRLKPLSEPTPDKKPRKASQQKNAVPTDAVSV